MRDPLTPKAEVTNVTDQKEYNRARSGNALHVVVAKPSAQGINIIGRGTNFSWQHNFQIDEVPEYNTRIVQETVTGKQTLGTGTLATLEVMAINDKLPTYKDLSAEEELLILQVTGDDEPIPMQVLNVFKGCKISGRSGSHGGAGLAMQNVSFIYRKHENGAEYKKQNAASPYPAEVK